jgi:hypothetical protein
VRRLRSLNESRITDIEFVRITDVAQGHEGTAVLDAGAWELVLLDSAQRELTRVGQYGSGPLDFRSALAVAFESSRVVRWYDGVLGLKRVEFASDGRARLLSTVAPTLSAFSACVGGTETVVLAPSSVEGSGASSAETENLIAVLRASDGRPRLRFGESYRASNVLTRHMMSEASVGCTATGHVGVGFVSLPLLRIYDVTGALRWSYRLVDFVQAYSIERLNDRGQATIGIDPSTRRFSQTRRVVGLGNDLLAFQVGEFEVSRREGLIERRLDTYLVSTRTGEAAYVGSHLPYLASGRDRPSIGFRDEPEPHLVRLSPP